MRTRTRITGLISFGLLWATATLNAQVTVESNTILTPNEFVGCDVNSLVELQVRHDGNFPIDWYTNAIRRVTLSPTLTGQTVNTYTPLNLSGHLGIGSFAALPGNPPPLTMLHLDNGGTEVAGYRPWMRTGTSMSEASEWMYVGFKRESADRIDAVINWADNREIFGGGQFGPDALRMVFTSPPTTTSVSGSLNGLEIARLIPDVSGDEGYFGIGDYFTAGVQPAERLDILDRTLRLRDFVDPTLYRNDTHDRVLVANPADGRVFWRPASSIGTGGADCDWTLNSSSPNHVSTAFGAANATCPDAAEAVGIGVNLGTSVPIAKLQLAFNATNGQSIDKGASFTLTGEKPGMVAGDFDVTGTGAFHAGVRAEASGALSESWTEGNAGVKAWALADASGSTHSNRGVHCGADVSAQNAVTDNVGVDIVNNMASNATVYENFGVRAELWTSYGNITNNYGGNFDVWTPCNKAATSYGLRARASGGTVNYGIHASVGLCDGNATGYAGYFGGNVNVTGTGYISTPWLITSDAQFKTNVEPLLGASALLAELRPRTYAFNDLGTTVMHLPATPQIGFIAQELEEVLPELVKSTIKPAQYDSVGVEVEPAVSFKAVNYTGLIPVLVAAMQEQQQRIEQMEQALAACCANPDAGDGRMHMGEEEGTTEGDARKLSIAPNPFHEQTTLYYTLEKAGRAQLLVNSSDGKQLRVLHEATQQAGEFQHVWNTTELAPGLYYVTLLLDGEPVVKKAVKVAR